MGEPFLCSLKCCCSLTFHDKKLSAFQNGYFSLKQLRLLECPHVTIIYLSIISSYNLPALHSSTPSHALRGSEDLTVALGMLRALSALIFTQYVLSLMKWRLRASALVIRGHRARLQNFEVRGVDGSAVKRWDRSL